MSLILEALRKSEAERQRGRLPAIATELPPAPAPRTLPAPAWKWPLFVACALALALAAWLAGAGWTRNDTGSTPAGRATATATAATSATSATSAENPARVHVDVLPPVDRLTPPAKAIEPSTEARATRAGASAAAAPSRIASLPGAAMDTVATAAAHAPAATPGTTPLPTPVAAPAAAGRGAALSLADLDPETRKALPPLRLSMHLWDADPARRFVILDGKRLGEGDRIGSVVLTAITRDGVLIDWNGRRIQVPLR